MEIAFTLLFKLCMFIFSASLGRRKSWKRLLSPHIPPHPFSCEAAVVSVYWAGDFLHRCGDPGCLFLFSRRHLTAPWGTITWKGSRVGRSCFLGRSLVMVYGDSTVSLLSPTWEYKPAFQDAEGWEGEKSGSPTALCTDVYSTPFPVRRLSWITVASPTNVPMVYAWSPRALWCEPIPKENLCRKNWMRSSRIPQMSHPVTRVLQVAYRKDEVMG